MTDLPPIKQVEDIDIFSRTGTVLDVQLISETEVRGSSSGGGGYVGPYGGNVSAPTISVSSTSHERAHIFLREDKGTEVEIDIRNPNLGIRKGHRLSAIYAGPKSASRGHEVALYNHDTGNQAIYNYRIEWTLKRTSPGIAALILLALPVSGCVGGGMFSGAASGMSGEPTIFALMPFALFVAGLIWAICLLIRSKARNDRLNKAIRDQAQGEIDRLAQTRAVAGRIAVAASGSHAS